MKTCSTLFFRLRLFCSQCRHLDKICVDDIRFVTTSRFFKSIHSFRTLQIEKKISAVEMRLLLDKWSQWDYCTISTRDMSRNATKIMLRTLQSLKSFSLECHILKPFHLSSSLEEFSLRNKASLHSLSLQGMTMRPLLSPFLNTPLRALSVGTCFKNSNELHELVMTLPQTLISLRLVNFSSCFEHEAPIYLLSFGRLTMLRHLELENCLMPCGLRCPHWRLVEAFCAMQTLSTFSTNYLTFKCLMILLSRGLSVRSLIINPPEKEQL